MYYNGQGVPQNYEQAVQWFQKAADQGEAIAQFNLGLMYANGWGVAKNHQMSIQWLRKAAAQGHQEAQKMLKNMGQTW